ncbi:unnamed protein product [Rotaria magnacalcarata]|uniref:Uncharacterized protein n=1 Tax=Rotaria magnacalcarata TaxID=392030 RepID=A0A8S2SB53_9BILA|nr:unnamed protein product [Rotaria magnacalcarata]CAF4210562.1 unnamed protein product [Rotaria magnacalcarata]
MLVCIVSFTKCQYQVKAKVFHDGIYQIFCSQHHEHESLENSIVPVEIRSVIRDLALNGLSKQNEEGCASELRVQQALKFAFDDTQHRFVLFIRLQAFQNQLLITQELEQRLAQVMKLLENEQRSTTIKAIIK